MIIDLIQLNSLILLNLVHFKFLYQGVQIPLLLPLVSSILLLFHVVLNHSFIYSWGGIHILFVLNHNIFIFIIFVMVLFFISSHLCPLFLSWVLFPPPWEVYISGLVHLHRYGKFLWVLPSVHVILVTKLFILLFLKSFFISLFFLHSPCISFIYYNLLS